MSIHYPTLRTTAIELANRYGARIVLVERAGTGHALFTDIRQSIRGRVIGVRPVGDKAMRLIETSGLIETGHMQLPDHDYPWIDTYRTELLGFPNGRHDDQVDSTTQFLKWARTSSFRPRGDVQRVRSPRPSRQRRRRRSTVA